MNLLYNNQNHSLYPRITLIGLETLIVCASGWLLLFNGVEIHNDWFDLGLSSGNLQRNVLLFVLILVVFRFL
ncbi:hypothetical protein KO561_04835 [Radiobacillus kanasensis]|uniref:hypothetical protein n=1 Tax=Radiobacillus kanasensis TaxID=2844358 RepID=UPI001E605B8C|nr:hypothetical protein [Radiobacillus kanasensis]UFU00281.1 hypothetical protein KO561_04835 [Radiobacillus kanasensis]